MKLSPDEGRTIDPCPWCEEVPQCVEAYEFVSVAIPCGHKVWVTIWPNRLELRPVV